MLSREESERNVARLTLYAEQILNRGFGVGLDAVGVAVRPLHNSIRGTGETGGWCGYCGYANMKVLSTMSESSGFDFPVVYSSASAVPISHATRSS